MCEDARFGWASLLLLLLLWLWLLQGESKVQSYFVGFAQHLVTDIWWQHSTCLFIFVFISQFFLTDVTWNFMDKRVSLLTVVVTGVILSGLSSFCPIFINLASWFFYSRDHLPSQGMLQIRIAGVCRVQLDVSWPDLVSRYWSGSVYLQYDTC